VNPVSSDQQTEAWSIKPASSSFSVCFLAKDVKLRSQEIELRHKTTYVLRFLYRINIIHGIYFKAYG